MVEIIEFEELSDGLWQDKNYLYLLTVILDASSSCHTVNFNIGGSTTTSRKWDIRVTQYACGDFDLAGTYFQYFNTPTYTIYSFFCVTKHYKIFEFQVGQVVYNIIQQQRPTFKSIFFVSQS